MVFTVSGVGQNLNMFPLSVLGSMFIPSMGFGNCLVYAYPRYQDLRRRFPDESCCSAIHWVLWDGGDRPRSTSFETKDPEEKEVIVDPPSPQMEQSLPAP